MGINSFPSAENSVPAWNVDLPPDNVFVTPIFIVGQNSYLVKDPTDIQTFIEEKLSNAGVKLSKTETEVDNKMRLDCKVALNPAAKDKCLQTETEYSSILVEIQLTQKPDIRLRHPYYDREICVQPNKNVIAGIENCLKDLLKKLTKKKYGPLLS